MTDWQETSPSYLQYMELSQGPRSPGGGQRLFIAFYLTRRLWTLICVCPPELNVACLIDHFFLVQQIHLHAVTLWQGLQCVQKKHIRNTSNGLSPFPSMASEQLPLCARGEGVRSATQTLLTVTLNSFLKCFRMPLEA